ncbi:hypothetical protein IAR50_005945 [Cryptococcus sp. DSM 104548]
MNSMPRHNVPLGLEPRIWPASSPRNLTYSKASITRRAPSVSTIDLFVETDGNGLRAIKDPGLSFRLSAALDKHSPANILAPHSLAADMSVKLDADGRGYQQPVFDVSSLSCKMGTAIWDIANLVMGSGVLDKAHHGFRRRNEFGKSGLQIESLLRHG